MLKFHIYPESEIPASKQLFNQIQFAIASGEYTPGHRLPSTRQLAMITGLHRNTISKVYQQLEEAGLVESQAGSGIYVKAQGYEGDNWSSSSPVLNQYPEANKLIKECLDGLLNHGFTLAQTQELLLSEIDWRRRCSAKILLTVPSRDLYAGKIMMMQLKQSLDIPVEFVPLEELPIVLKKAKSATVVTIRYFIQEVAEAIQSESIRIIPLDIYDYDAELGLIKKLPPQTYLGIVSLSKGTLEVAESILHSLRGDDILVISAQAQDKHRLNVLVRTANKIICDTASLELVRQAVAAVRDDLIRYPEIICIQNYISLKSIDSLKRELGLGGEIPTA